LLDYVKCGIIKLYSSTLKINLKRSLTLKGKDRHGNIKQHRWLNVTYNVVLKMPMATFTDEEYNVYVEYDGLEEVFDNKKLYQKTKKNQKIALLLVERIDRRGRVIKRTLELPE